MGNTCIVPEYYEEDCYWFGLKAYMGYDLPHCTCYNHQAPFNCANCPSYESKKHSTQMGGDYYASE